jgi:hypothetical protein
LTSIAKYVILNLESEGDKMTTLNKEIARIKSETAEIASKAFTGKTIQEQVEQMFAEIIPQKYNASEKKY